MGGSRCASRSWVWACVGGPRPRTGCRTFQPNVA
jgi:hypothetical protein